MANLVPVDHDPFGDGPSGSYTIVPVDHDPEFVPQGPQDTLLGLAPAADATGIPSKWPSATPTGPVLPGMSSRSRQNILEDVMGVARGTLDWMMTPGRAMREGITPEEETSWGVNTALTTMGATPFSAPRGALGAGPTGRIAGEEPAATAAARRPAQAGGLGPPGPGGSAGGGGGLEAAQGAATQAAGSTTPLKGLPQKPLTIEGQQFVPGPIERVKQAAQNYMDEAGLPYDPPTIYAKVDAQRATRIAQAFEDMPHDPTNPRVHAAYQAMVGETLAQFQHIKAMGTKFDFIAPGQPDPYAASPRLAAQDFRDNNHLWVYPTDTGFGSTEIGAAAAPTDVARGQSPLLQPVNEFINGKQLLANDVFRIVHDVFGHFKEGVGFRAEGEENAWRSHAAMYSDQALPAMTAETRGQNSWVNYGPYGEKNRTASTPDTVFAEQKMGMLPDWVMNEGREESYIPVNHNPFADLRVSTRLPTAVRATENPLGPERLTIDTKAMKSDPELFAHNVGLVKQYPNLTTAEKAGSPDQVANNFTNHVKDNLLWLYDRIDPAIRDRSMNWYDGGNRIVGELAQRYGTDPKSSAAVLAALSPQKDWFQNVSLAYRVHDVHFNHGHEPYSPGMHETASEIYTSPEQKKLATAIAGKSYDELTDPFEKAAWLRLYDQSHVDPYIHTITPEGYSTDYERGKPGAQGEPGTPKSIMWGSNVEMAKAVKALQSNGDISAISPLLGEKHKVRNFYNNLIDPNSPAGDVTIDTHAVAAGLLRPLSGNDIEVAHNFGNYPGANLPSAKGSAVSGVSGTYGLYADAYRQAAAERGILPRQMQSATWEAVRGLFSPAFKANKANKTAIDDIWKARQRGVMSTDEARDKIFNAAGGIDPPSWARGAMHRR